MTVLSNLSFQIADILFFTIGSHICLPFLLDMLFEQLGQVVISKLLLDIISLTIWEKTELQTR